MKNTSFKTKLIARMTVLVMILTTIFMNGCQWYKTNGEVSEEGLRKGFDNIDLYGEVQHFLFMAYESNDDEFDIDNVTLNFSYGRHYVDVGDVQHTIDAGLSYPNFDLCFVNDEGTTIVVKHVEENLISEKYMCEPVYSDKIRLTKVTFNHSEKLTIPKELFNKDSGIIWFCIYGTNIKEYNPRYQLVNGIDIYYKKEGNTIILSTKSFS